MALPLSSVLGVISGARGGGGRVKVCLVCIVDERNETRCAFGWPAVFCCLFFHGGTRHFVQPMDPPIQRGVLSCPYAVRFSCCRPLVCCCGAGLDLGSATVRRRRGLSRVCVAGGVDTDRRTTSASSLVSACFESRGCVVIGFRYLSAQFGRLWVLPGPRVHAASERSSLTSCRMRDSCVFVHLFLSYFGYGRIQAEKGAPQRCAVASD